ncbi:MAG: hypothetical protein HKN04_06575 [Rhodothermaceae bacterium]|nr:hypothetical protein [Rhodothermaceae bacterium]
MFLTLLLVTFLVALAVSGLVARGFDRPIGSILGRIIADDISAGWQRFVRFALLVVGISGGVRIYELERYIDPERTAALALTTERWVLEVYRTVIETLQSLAWALLVFFMFALLAYVIVRRGEIRREVVERDIAASKPLI